MIGQEVPINKPMRRSESTRALSGVAIVVTTLVALFGFWRLEPGATFIVACLALVGLVISLWIAGGPTTRS
jgi:hypothetical protein